MVKSWRPFEQTEHVAYVRCTESPTGDRSDLTALFQYIDHIQDFARIDGLIADIKCGGAL